MNIEELSDVKSESGVVGTLIYHPEFIAHSDYLKPNYFYEQDNACIFWAIQELYNKGITNIDAYNITNQLQSNSGVWGTIEKYNLSNVQEFISLYKNVARNTLAEYKMLVNNIVSLSFRRDLLKTLNEIDTDCFDKKKTLEALSSDIYKKIDELTKKYVVSGDISLLGESIDAIWEEIVNRRRGGGIYGLPSKYKSFMKYFTYEPGELVVLQAKYKQGKSVFLMNEAVHKLQSGVPTLVVDSEMPTRLYVERLISHLSGVSIYKVKSGECNEEEESKIQNAIAWIKEQPLVHIYDADMTMDKLYSICKVLQNKMNLGFVVFDYIKSNETSASDNYNLLGAKCDFLKNKIAGELDVPVLAACQLNRQGEIADSMKINRYLSVGIKWEYKTQEMIARDGVQCGNACARIYVNRLGRQMPDDDEMAYIDFNFDGDIMTITEANQHDTSDGEDIF